MKTVSLCSRTGVLVVGGLAGQVLLCHLDNKREFDIAVTDLDLMAEDEDFVWKGQEALDVRSCQFRHPAGFRPEDIVQLDPPSSVTSLAINTDWGLVAAGNSQTILYFN